ncbi:hypothetical protein BDV96DRAFT_596783 [Lophiotrema nucula]|uniref:RING-type domain-containing protein n=1 Tax=Lophiotrema nucula TaxID=690887 RepID=A0A6A5ZIW9_9PLEO|nr:hypothetical protein BDV96DRAFT_596783 [Lophiotrema nucula]
MGSLLSIFRKTTVRHPVQIQHSVQVQHPVQDQQPVQVLHPIQVRHNTSEPSVTLHALTLLEVFAEHGDIALTEAVQSSTNLCSREVFLKSGLRPVERKDEEGQGECSICREPYSYSEGNNAAVATTCTCIMCRAQSSEQFHFHRAVITPCDHIFGEDCLRSWLDDPKVNTCPMCRMELFEGEEDINEDVYDYDYGYESEEGSGEEYDHEYDSETDWGEDEDDNEGEHDASPNENNALYGDFLGGDSQRPVYRPDWDDRISGSMEYDEEGNQVRPPYSRLDELPVDVRAHLRREQQEHILGEHVISANLRALGSGCDDD